MTRLPFYGDCVGWPNELLPALSHLVDEGEEITRSTFVRHCGPSPYPGSAWHVHYFRLRGYRIYWFTWSCIEHVYAEVSEITRLNKTIRKEAA